MKFFQKKTQTATGTNTQKLERDRELRVTDLPVGSLNIAYEILQEEYEARKDVKTADKLRKLQLIITEKSFKDERDELKEFFLAKGFEESVIDQTDTNYLKRLKNSMDQVESLASELGKPEEKIESKETDIAKEALQAFNEEMEKSEKLKKDYENLKKENEEIKKRIEKDREKIKKTTQEKPKEVKEKKKKQESILKKNVNISGLFKKKVVVQKDIPKEDVDIKKVTEEAIKKNKIKQRAEELKVNTEKSGQKVPEPKKKMGFPSIKKKKLPEYYCPKCKHSSRMHLDGCECGCFETEEDIVKNAQKVDDFEKAINEIPIKKDFTVEEKQQFESDAKAMEDMEKQKKKIKTDPSICSTCNHHVSRHSDSKDWCLEMGCTCENFVVKD